MNSALKRFFICIAIPLAVGGLSALLTMGSMKAFGELNQPPLSPPGWLFPIVWTVLYTLMGISLFIVVEQPKNKEKSRAILLFALQLFFNFMWSIFFFNLKLYFFSFVWLVGLWGLIILMILSFKKVSAAAAYINIPYLLWVSFAGYLNFMVWMLNK